MLKEMIANLQHAASTGKQGHVGGGIFTPAEQKAAAEQIAALQNNPNASTPDLDTLIANCKKAAFDRTSASIGGGTFDHQELKQFVDQVQALRTKP